MNGTIEENELLQVLKGKLNKIPDYESISKVYEAQTEADAEKIIDDVYLLMPDNSQKIIEINLAEFGDNLPVSSYRVTICRFYEAYGFIELTSERYGTIFRTKHEIWEEWEWESPPMWEGKEYCLTERYEAQKVYTKILRTTWNSGQRAEFEVPDAKIVVNYSARYHDRTLPYVTMSGGIVGIGVSTNAVIGKVFVEMNGDTENSGLALFLQIWYIKN